MPKLVIVVSEGVEAAFRSLSTIVAVALTTGLGRDEAPQRVILGYRRASRYCSGGPAVR